MAERSRRARRRDTGRPQAEPERRIIWEVADGEPRADRREEKAVVNMDGFDGSQTAAHVPASHTRPAAGGQGLGLVAPRSAL